MEYHILDKKTMRRIGLGVAAFAFVLVAIYFAIVVAAFNKQHALLQKVCDRNFPEIEYQIVDGKKVITPESIGRIVLRVEGLKEYCVEQEAK
jgi:hypothetical protein